METCILETYTPDKPCFFLGAGTGDGYVSRQDWKVTGKKLGCCQGSCWEPGDHTGKNSWEWTLGCGAGSDCLSSCLWPLVKADSPANTSHQKGPQSCCLTSPTCSTSCKTTFQHPTAKLKPLIQNQSHRTYKVSQGMKQKRTLLMYYIHEVAGNVEVNRWF